MLSSASRLGLWLGAVLVVGAVAVATSSALRRAEAPAAPSPAVEATAPAAIAAPAAPVVAAVTPVTRTPARKASAPKDAIPAAANSAGLWIFLDPETGLIGPPSSDAVVELPQVDPNYESDGLLQVRLPDGSIMMNLEGRYQMHSTVTLGPDGRPVFHCGQTPHAAHAGCTLPAQIVEE